MLQPLSCWEQINFWYLPGLWSTSCRFIVSYFCVGSPPRCQIWTFNPLNICSDVMWPELSRISVLFAAKLRLVPCDLVGAVLHSRSVAMNCASHSAVPLWVHHCSVAMSCASLCCITGLLVMPCASQCCIVALLQCCASPPPRPPSPPLYCSVPNVLCLPLCCSVVMCCLPSPSISVVCFTLLQCTLPDFCCVAAMLHLFSL